jgi:hypothetical protein
MLAEKVTLCFEENWGYPVFLGRLIGYFIALDKIEIYNKLVKSIFIHQCFLRVINTVPFF